jgi:hypothetical protein
VVSSIPREGSEKFRSFVSMVDDQATQYHS